MSKRAIKIGLTASWIVAIAIFVALVLKAQTSPSCEAVVEIFTGRKGPCPTWNATVFLRMEATGEQANDIGSTLRRLVTVRRAVYVSKEAALEEYEEQHRDQPEILQMVDRQGFRASFRVWIHDGARLESLGTALAGNEAVETVTPNRIRRLENLGSGWRTLRNVWGIATLIALAALTAVSVYLLRQQDRAEANHESRAL